MTVFELISRTGQATWKQLYKELDLSSKELGAALRELMDAGKVEEEPKMTYNLPDVRISGREMRLSRQYSTAEVLNGLCPFRGGNEIRLDERCPETIPVEMTGGETSEGATMLVPVPLLRLDTYCYDCVYHDKREKELGKRGRRK